MTSEICTDYIVLAQKPYDTLRSKRAMAEWLEINTLVSF